MDSRSSIKGSIVWDIETGSLVKIKKQDLDGETYYQNGIVISDKKISQLEMFPFVEVYTFETQAISREFGYSLEIVSRPSDEIHETDVK